MRSAIVVLLLAICCSPAVSAGNQCGRPALRGSFLQPALGDRWTLQQWRNEFHYMKDAGLDQMVIQWTADSEYKTTIYPSGLAGYTQNTKHDVVERALDTADASGAQVYLGLQINDDWWTYAANNGPWLRNEANVANALADDLWGKYGQHKSLTGWYLGFEVDNVSETTPVQWDRQIAFYRTVGNHLHKLTPGKPVAIAPFFNAQIGLSSSEWQAMWEYILKKSPIDIVALQDGMGVGHATRSELPEWFGAVRNAIQNARPSAQFWADTETFNRVSEPMPIHDIVDDMCAEQPYVSSYLSFSFNHYMSPQQVNPLYYRTYMDYLATGTVESTPPTKPANLTAVALDYTTIRLKWTASTDDVGVVGYIVRRNGQHLTTLYDAATTYVDSGLDSSTTYSYEIKAFDAAGNVSPVSDPATATTPAPHLYPTNLALGKPYTATMAANPSYPDTGGVELTDGILGSASYTDPAWQGRATTRNYSFTIDLGAVEAIKEVRSNWLQDLVSGILLPKQVNCSVSADNVNFIAVGTANTPLPGDGTLSLWYTLTDLKDINGRYVRVEVIPGGSAEWTFIDEIEVRQ